MHIHVVSLIQYFSLCIIIILACMYVWWYMYLHYYLQVVSTCCVFIHVHIMYLSILYRISSCRKFLVTTIWHMFAQCSCNYFSLPTSEVEFNRSSWTFCYVTLVTWPISIVREIICFSNRWFYCSIMQFIVSVWGTLYMYAYVHIVYSNSLVQTLHMLAFGRKYNIWCVLYRVFQAT